MSHPDDTVIISSAALYISKSHVNQQNDISRRIKIRHKLFEDLKKCIYYYIIYKIPKASVKICKEKEV